MTFPSTVSSTPMTCGFAPSAQIVTEDLQVPRAVSGIWTPNQSGWILPVFTLRVFLNARPLKSIPEVLKQVIAVRAMFVCPEKPDQSTERSLTGFL